MWEQVDFSLLDTGGLFGASEDPLHALVVERGRKALQQADLIVVVFDGQEGLVPGDLEIVQQVRTLDLPVVVAVNKTDVKRAREGVTQFYELGLDPIFEVSAEHGTGVGDLLDEIIRRLPAVARSRTRAALAPPTESDAPQPSSAPTEVGVAIVGRPNAGK